MSEVNEYVLQNFQFQLVSCSIGMRKADKFQDVFEKNALIGKFVFNINIHVVALYICLYTIFIVV